MMKPNRPVKNNDLIFQGTYTDGNVICKNFHSSLLAFRVDGSKNKLKIIKIIILELIYASLTNNAELGHDEAADSVKKPTKPGFYRDLPTRNFTSVPPPRTTI